jgi:hypothetical protein
MAHYFDREYLGSPNLSDWLQSFADKEIKSGNTYDGIQSIFKKKNELDSVEARVKELRERVGLDLIEDETIKLADQKKEANLYGMEKRLDRDGLEQLKSEKIKQFHNLTGMFKRTVDGDEEHMRKLNEVLVDIALIEMRIEELDSQNSDDEHIPGGLSSGKEEDDYDKKQLEMGVKIEKEEHTNSKDEEDKEIATEIAKDHLQENKKYYTYLNEMEDKMDGEKKAQMINYLVIKANHYDSIGNVKLEKKIDFVIAKLAEEKKSILEKNEKIPKIIQKVVDSRGGHVDSPAVLDVLLKEIQDINLSKDDEDEIRDLIKKTIKETKRPVKDENDLSGIGVVLVTTEGDAKEDAFGPGKR